MRDRGGSGSSSYDAGHGGSAYVGVNESVNAYVGDDYEWESVTD